MTPACRPLWPVILLFLPLLIFQPAGPSATEPARESLEWIHSDLTEAAHFDYVMGVRLRLLFFWVGKENVGGGFIRHGIARSNPRQELLQVLFGSDPAKAPRAINRWGAGTEAVWHQNPVSLTSKDDDVMASTFFGFMKSSSGKSVSEMQEELRKEKDRGEHQFTGIVSHVERGQATSLVVPLGSSVDYNLHQYADAEPLMLRELNTTNKPVRTLTEPPDCQRAAGFLGTVSQLLNAEGENPRNGLTLCYVYDAQVNTLTVEHTAVVSKLVVKVLDEKTGAPKETVYDDLLQTDFVSMHHSTGKKSYFTILTGKHGDLRNVPVQIRYQPNWWFQIVLNLHPSPPAPSDKP